MQQPVGNQRKSWRLQILLTVLGGAAVLGIWAASAGWISFYRQKGSTTNTSGREIIIDEIVVGAVAKDAVGQPNPALQVKADYFMDEPLGIRITPKEDFGDPIEIHARLLKASGQVVELDPPSVTLQLGQYTFCCWRLNEAGKFSLQLFRPEGVITTIPLAIKPSLQPGTGNIKVF